MRDEDDGWGMRIREEDENDYEGLRWKEEDEGWGWGGWGWRMRTREEDEHEGLYEWGMRMTMWDRITFQCKMQCQKTLWCMKSII